MIAKIVFTNPINNKEDILIVKYPDVDYGYYRSLAICNDDAEIINILNSILLDINCTREYDCGRPCMTNQFNYIAGISRYYYYLLKLTNQIIYNEYIDKLIKRHIDNLIFEYEHPYVPKVKNKSKVKSKNKKSNIKYEKFITRDIFTGDEVYIYENIKTKEIIESDNPDLLEELNSPTKKVTKHKNSNIKDLIEPKKGGVPISSMTFSFKMK